MVEYPILKIAKDPKQRELCYRWFERNMGRLPASLELSGMEIPDLRYTVQRIISEVRSSIEHAPIYQGEFALLERIRQTVLKMPDFQETPVVE